MSIDITAPGSADLSLRVASEIKTAMVRRGMSGRDLAKAMGVSPAWISYRLTGNQEIGVNDLQRIAAILQVKAADLIGHAERGDGAYVSVGFPPADVTTSVPRQRLPRSPLAVGYPSGGRPPGRRDARGPGVMTYPTGR